MIGVGAAIENIFPPIPADTFVLLGAFLSTRGAVNAFVVFIITWVLNVGSAAWVYSMAHRYGRGFFTTRVGHWLLKPKQLQRVGDFYERWGTMAIFASRFLPAFRAVVPVFAGVTHMQLSRVLPPMIVASGLWYGLLVYIGTIAGSNWEAIIAFFSQFSAVLGAVAFVLIAIVAIWWYRSRHDHDHA